MKFSIVQGIGSLMKPKAKKARVLQHWRQGWGLLLIPLSTHSTLQIKSMTIMVET